MVSGSRFGLLLVAYAAALLAVLLTAQGAYAAYPDRPIKVVVESRAGVDLVHIPYKGTGSAMPDLLSGVVALMFPNLPSALPFIKTGKLKALGVTSATRSAAAPDIPSLAEGGVPGYAMSTWYGLVGPAHMPADIVSRLNQELISVLQDPQVSAKMIAQGVDPVVSSPAEFTAFITAETNKWSSLIKTFKVKVD